ncbi:MAG: TonB-dependent receptor [Tolypothrix brevis GSE-NOS-MK-07-07A]|jgi:hypothetical protein|nr:TonB-dependent receptor [Tolypothrix brevis GSE-NOS-MK-07-07A]
MNKRLIIKDLNYLEQVKENTVLGGDDVVALTGTITRTGPGYASAGAVAFAAGQINGIDIQTQTSASPSISFANARAEAYGRTGNDTAVSLSYSNSNFNPRSSNRFNSLSFNSTTTTSE